MVALPNYLDRKAKIPWEVSGVARKCTIGEVTLIARQIDDTQHVIGYVAGVRIHSACAHSLAAAYKACVTPINQHLRLLYLRAGDEEREAKKIKGAKS